MFFDCVNTAPRTMIEGRNASAVASIWFLYTEKKQRKKSVGAVGLVVELGEGRKGDSGSLAPCLPVSSSVTLSEHGHIVIVGRLGRAE